MCKPHKMNGVKKRRFIPRSGVISWCDQAGPWKQEAQAHLGQLEQEDEWWNDDR
jgi:hypothetical protein